MNQFKEHSPTMDGERHPFTDTGQIVQLGSRQDINYLKPTSILGFASIHLVSFEGQTFLMDKTVLAAASKLFCDLLLDQEDCNERVVFNTQIPKGHLSLFCQFVSTGTLPCGSFDPNLVSSFNNLGINLEGGMKLESVPAASLPKFDLSFSVPCNVEVVIKKEETENGGLAPLSVSEFEPAKSQNITRQSSRSRKVKNEWESYYENEEDPEDCKDFDYKAEEDVQIDDANGMDEANAADDWQMDQSEYEEEKPLVRKKRGKYKKKNKPVNPDQPEESWDCNVCDEKFTSRLDLKEHTNKVHADIPLTCHICNVQFPSRQLGRLKNHIRKVHETPKKKAESSVCICCGDFFETRRKHQEHLRKRGKFHNNRCAYKECVNLDEFKTWPEHEDHIKKVHGGEFPSRCRHCPEYFQTDYLMRQHIKKVHPDLKTTASLPREMCVHCGKIIFKSAMQDHFDRQHGNKEHPCDVCQRIFYSKQQLKSHKETHEKMNPCPHCGKHLSIRALGQHILLNHTPDHLKPHRCPYCPKGFTSADNLKYHLNTHTGEKPFKCHICNAAFSHPANQKAHIRAHEGIKRKK